MNSLNFIVLGTPGKSDMIWFYAAALGILLFILLIVWFVRFFWQWLHNRKTGPGQEIENGPIEE